MSFIHQFMINYNLTEQSSVFVAAVANTPNIKRSINHALGIHEDDQELLLLSYEQSCRVANHVLYPVLETLQAVARCVDIVVNEGQILDNTTTTGAKFSRALVRALKDTNEVVWSDIAEELKENINKLRLAYKPQSKEPVTVENMLQVFYDILGTRKKGFVYITNKADDFFGLSENCNWSSCVNIGGGYDGSCSAWMRHDKTAIIYGTTDKDTRKKFFRCLLHVDVEERRFMIGRVYGNVEGDAITTIRQAIQRKLADTWGLSDGKWRYSHNPTYLDYTSQEADAGAPYRDTPEVGSVWVPNEQRAATEDEDEENPGGKLTARHFNLGNLTSPMCIGCGTIGGDNAVCSDCTTPVVCVDCGRNIERGDERIRPNGNAYCSDCYEANHITCPNCSRMVFADDAEYAILDGEEVDVCQSCATNLRSLGDLSRADLSGADLSRTNLRNG